MNQTFILYSFVSVYALWLFYLAAMNLIRAKEVGTLSRPAYWLGLPLIVLGVVLDWLVNFTVCIVLFSDLPANWSELVTGRLKRYAYDTSQTWRRALAIWMGKNLLDTFDPSGKHI